MTGIPINPDPARDHCSKEGAARLIVRLEDFWRRRLHRPSDVTFSIAKVGDNDEGRPVYGVRSNLVRGLPAEQ